MALKGSLQNAKVRVLLVVWSEKKLRKGQLNDRLKRSGEKSEDYIEALEQLKIEDAIAEEKNVFSITDNGIDLLRKMLLDSKLNPKSDDEPERPFNFQNDDLSPDPKKPEEKKKVGQIGAKFGDVLLKWIREESSSNGHASSEIIMDFETFIVRFNEVYLNERKLQEIDGASVIYKNDICKIFASQNPISESLLEKYYNKLKTNGNILTVLGRDGEMIQWVD